jgi:hypothetical protein
LKLSTQTIEILRWCDKLQPGLLIRPGSRICSISSNKAVILDANVAETFPCRWGISDLRPVISQLSEATEITFRTNSLVELRQGNTCSELPNVSPEEILAPPDKPLRLQDDETFFLHADDAYELRNLVKTGRAGPLRSWRIVNRRTAPAPIIVFDSTERDQLLRFQLHSSGFSRDVVKRRRPTLEHSLTVAPQTDIPMKAKWRITFHARNLQLAAGAYEVSFARRGIARFRWLLGDVALFVSIESLLSSVDGEPLHSNAPVIIDSPTQA